jgi:hypothetical protein
MRNNKGSQERGQSATNIYNRSSIRSRVGDGGGERINSTNKKGEDDERGSSDSE